MSQLLGVDANGNINDNVVERMFHDLYYGSYVEDDLTRRNINTYMKVLYGEEFEISDLSDTGELVTIVTEIFSNVDITRVQRYTNDDLAYEIRLEHWSDDLHVTSASLSCALAMAIVEDMRHLTRKHINRGDKTSH